MKTSEFDYYLPLDRIAQTPVEPRDSSRLLVLHRATGVMEHRTFTDLLEYLRPGDLLVANESRVIPARLFGRKVGSGGKVEILLLARRDDLTWECLVRGRKLAAGARVAFEQNAPAEERDHTAAGGHDGRGLCLEAQIVGTLPHGTRLIRFDRPVEPNLDRLGLMPLPPYIHTPLADPSRYQTVYARVQGSAAAPTAGLHFTPDLIARIRSAGIGFAFVTLHIGLDTFKPIGEENVESHHIHTEQCVVPAETVLAVARVRSAGGRVIVVGTTAVRALESAADPQSSRGLIKSFAGPTSLYMYPGREFRVVDGLITNFHLPRSTLLCLVSAFAGKERIDAAYAEAVRLGYRFYSFGDAMLIL